MGAITREKGVLKLVHRGRYVEMLTQPITAAEVMRRNPRHLVTRPDVFEFPYIMVKPEAVLVPGKVFFIVPNRTIYHLLKAKKGLNHDVNHKHHSSIKSNAGSTPKYNLGFKPQFRNTSWDEPREHDYYYYEKKRKKQSPLQCCPRPQMIEKYKRSPTKFRQIILEDSTTEFRHTYYTSNQISVKLPKTENPDPLSECGTSRQVTMLKPCLRKPDSHRKFLHLRVTFNLSINDAKQQRRHSVSPPKFVGYLNL
ncbi:hypothetical protein ACJW30_12G179400 [Castanea mollissima]